MKFARIFSSELDGINARIVEVEVDLNVGLHAFNVVGLADRSLNEAKERVNSALKNSGARPPNRENRRITVNLAPADMKKTGSQYDLAIALGYLLATEQIAPFQTTSWMFLGELALDGRLRAINGALNIAEMAVNAGFKRLFLPQANANEASVVSGIEIIPVESLKEVIAFLENKKEFVRKEFADEKSSGHWSFDFSEIRGQKNAKRALLIAASGRHNILMIGVPGVGKSMLAQAFVGILPDMDIEESIETTKIWSVAGMPLSGLIKKRPFRAPHQSASLQSIVGGGTEPRPGEISLANQGVLFLDEIPEFPRQIIEALRGPLENGTIEIARARNNFLFPAKFSLVAAMNPCPCGFYGDTEKECRCDSYEIVRYQKKISGPFLDRIDLQIKIQRVPIESFRQPKNPDSETLSLKAIVENTRVIQKKRFHNLRKGLRTNSDMSSTEVDELIELSGDAERFLSSLRNARLSPRGYYRLLKTARTIADIEQREKVEPVDLAEAWSYRLHEENS